jgi:hypothetical protein
MKNPFINMKTVITGRFKAVVGDGAGSGASQNFLKAGVGAGAETNRDQQHWEIHMPRWNM